MALLGPESTLKVAPAEKSRHRADCSREVFSSSTTRKAPSAPSTASPVPIQKTFLNLVMLCLAHSLQRGFAQGDDAPLAAVWVARGSLKRGRTTYWGLAVCRHTNAGCRRAWKRGVSPPP